MVGEDVRDSSSGERILGESSTKYKKKKGQPIPLKDGRFKGMAGSLVSVYSPKRITSKIWKKG